MQQLLSLVAVIRAGIVSGDWGPTLPSACTIHRRPSSHPVRIIPTMLVLNLVPSKSLFPRASTSAGIAELAGGPIAPNSLAAVLRISALGSLSALAIAGTTSYP